MLIKDYKGEVVNADVVYAVPTKHGNDYVGIGGLQKYASINRKGYGEILASATLVNISD